MAKKNAKREAAIKALGTGAATNQVDGWLVLDDGRTPYRVRRCAEHDGIIILQQLKNDGRKRAAIK